MATCENGYWRNRDLYNKKIPSEGLCRDERLTRATFPARDTLFMIGIRTSQESLGITVAALWRIQTSLPQSQTIFLLTTLAVYTSLKIMQVGIKNSLI